MASAFAKYGFVQVIFIAALIAIALQCLVYFVRRRLGLRAASAILHGSLLVFALVAAASLLIAVSSGSLGDAVQRGGSGSVTDFAFFIALTMFVSYFMGARYLADERERAGRQGREDVLRRGADHPTGSTRDDGSSEDSDLQEA